MLNTIYSSESQGVKKQCIIIVDKLKATISQHGDAFPQLKEIDRLLNISMPDTDSEQDHLQRLEELCSLLQQLSVSSYVVRHLHHNLCADVEATKNYKPISEGSSYLILPD